MGWTDLSPADAQAKTNEGGVLWIDVRTAGEYSQKGHVPGAILAPHTEIDRHLDAITAHSGAKIVTCEHGVRSMHAIRILDQAGVPDLYNLQTGMATWTGAREMGTDPGDPSAAQTGGGA